MTFTTVAAPSGPMPARRGADRSPGCSKTSAGWRCCCCCRPWCCSALFIAYPFVKGVMLSVTDTRVGVPGHFVGLQNFEEVWNDSIFRVAVWNTCVYTLVATVVKLALGLWLAVLLNQNFRGKALTRAFILLPFIIPTVLSTLAWKWMFDPTFSVINWMLFRLGVIHGADQLARRSRSGADLGDHRECLARPAVLCDHLARRAADDQPRIARGRGDRRRAARGSVFATSPGRCCCR